MMCMNTKALDKLIEIEFEEVKINKFFKEECERLRDEINHKYKMGLIDGIESLIKLDGVPYVAEVNTYFKYKNEIERLRKEFQEVL